MGDSRLYAFRGGTLLQRTNDHSLAQQLIDTGYVSAEEMRGSFQRARLYAALGDSDPPPPTVIEEPFGVSEGDAFLLCTDGWWDSLEAGAIEHGLAQANGADDWLRSMERDIVDQHRPGRTTTRHLLSGAVRARAAERRDGGASVPVSAKCMTYCAAMQEFRDPEGLEFSVVGESLRASPFGTEMHRDFVAALKCALAK